jgi:hypothetical protein
MDRWRNTRRIALGMLVFVGIAATPVARVHADRPSTLAASVAAQEVAGQMTAIFISGFSPPPGNPPPPPNPPGVTPPPPPPPPPGPPGPVGGGNPPPETNPGPPPSASPEPASMLTALLGAGLASLAAWRYRRRKQAEE